MLAKTDLKEAIAGKNRGLLATPAEQAAILAAIARVESLNPTPNPVDATDLLEGDWRLLYTSSQELLGIDRFPVIKLGSVYQCVRVAKAEIYNIAEVAGVPGLAGLVTVAAQFEPASQQRVSVRFCRGVVGLQRLVNYQSPAQFIAQLDSTAKLPFYQALDFRINRDRQQGWLDITYLDAEMRIGRGNEGSVFVLTKG